MCLFLSSWQEEEDIEESDGEDGVMSDSDSSVAGEDGVEEEEEEEEEERNDDDVMRVTVSAAMVKEWSKKLKEVYFPVVGRTGVVSPQL